MSETSDLLFTYLRSIFYNKFDVELDLDQLDKDYLAIGKGLIFFAQNVAQYHEFAHALARGDLSAEMPPRENELAAPLKSLQANLKHLTWQTQQVAKGDYKQHVDFMGEFADAFNTMVAQLSDRQQKLEEEIVTSRNHANALEQSNLLLGELTHYISEQLFVFSKENHVVFHANELARHETESDPDYLIKLVKHLSREKPLQGNNSFEVCFNQGNKVRYLTINTYQIEWSGQSSIAMLVNDISSEKMQMMELEKHAYRDALTSVYNRFYGMITLNEWLTQKRKFSLVFCDLDNLKYVNDKHGHREGDVYLTKVANYLQQYSEDAMVCRLGGDEYMLLAPEAGSNEAHMRIGELQNMISNDDYLEGKDYYYSISFGIVAVDSDNKLSSSDILSIADERMYEHKQARKKVRWSG